jgi:ADP-ribosylglycohydrolase
MGHQIIKQSNGKYAIFSSIVDDFILANVTPEEIIEYYIKRESEDIRKRINKTIDQLNSGEKPYYQFTMTLEEALDTIKDVHGEKKYQESLEYFKKTKE